MIKSMLLLILALKLFSLGFLLMITLNVSYTSCIGHIQIHIMCSDMYMHKQMQCTNKLLTTPPFTTSSISFWYWLVSSQTLKVRVSPLMTGLGSGPNKARLITIPGLKSNIEYYIFNFIFKYR